MAITKIKIDGVVYEIESAAPTTITFTIANTSYQAEEGMTWEQWCSSSYNTGGYYVGYYSTNIPVIYDSGTLVVYTSGPSTRIAPTDIIVNGGDYALVSLVHSGGTND